MRALETDELVNYRVVRHRESSHRLLQCFVSKARAMSENLAGKGLELKPKNSSQVVAYFYKQQLVVLDIN